MELPAELLQQIRTVTEWPQNLRPVLNRRSKFFELMLLSCCMNDIGWIIDRLWCDKYCMLCGERYLDTCNPEDSKQRRCRYDSEEAAARYLLQKRGRRVRVDRYWNEYHCDGKVRRKREAYLEVQEWVKQAQEGWEGWEGWGGRGGNHRGRAYRYQPHASNILMKLLGIASVSSSTLVTIEP